MCGLKLEVGKYYKTRNGEKVLVESEKDHGGKYTHVVERNSGPLLSYTENGNYWYSGKEDDLDIISLWEDELQLEVGKIYLNGKGERIHITELCSFNTCYPFGGLNLESDMISTYTKSGKHIKNQPSERDLVSIYTQKTNNMKYRLKQEFDTLTMHKVVERFLGSWGRFITKEQDIATLKDLKILDVWFEEVKEETITMGSGDKTFTLTIKDDKIFHKDEDITEYVINLIGLYYFPKVILPKRFAHVKEVTFSKTGCEEVETTLSEWKNVYDKIKKS